MGNGELMFLFGCILGTMRNIRWVVGVDEAGRGPLAGPVSVAAVAFPESLYREHTKVIGGIRDSKKLTELGRGRWYTKLLAQAKTGVFLEGSLAAPALWRNQKTIVRGDDRMAIIAAASVIAKVRRDRRMERLSLRYPDYGFAIHKGYGTASHYRILKKRGLSGIHRRSFCKKMFPMV